jgi:hypothetical protein
VLAPEGAEMPGQGEILGRGGPPPVLMEERGEAASARSTNRCATFDFSSKETHSARFVSPFAKRATKP